MKKLLVISVVFALVLSLAACGESGEAREGTGIVNQQSTVNSILEAAQENANAAAQPSINPGDLPVLSGEPEPVTVPIPEIPDYSEPIDVDLTKLSATMVYSEVSNMMYESDEYFGKVVRMRGAARSSYYKETDTTYYAVLIADATACCAQGIEYLLTDGYAYPEDGNDVVVTGVFTEYEENGMYYLRLDKAAITVVA